MPHGGLRQDDLRGAVRCFRITDDSLEKCKSVQISVDGSTKIPDDGISFVGANNKVSFTKLQLDSAVQQAVKATVKETVTALAKNGWNKP